MRYLSLQSKLLNFSFIACLFLLIACNVQDNESQPLPKGTENWEPRPDTVNWEENALCLNGSSTCIFPPVKTFQGGELNIPKSSRGSFLVRLSQIEKRLTLEFREPFTGPYSFTGTIYVLDNRIPFVEEGNVLGKYSYSSIQNVTIDYSELCANANDTSLSLFIKNAKERGRGKSNERVFALPHVASCNSGEPVRTEGKLINDASLVDYEFNFDCNESFQNFTHAYYFTFETPIFKRLAVDTEMQAKIPLMPESQLRPIIVSQKVVGQYTHYDFWSVKVDTVDYQICPNEILHSKVSRDSHE